MNLRRHKDIDEKTIEKWLRMKSEQDWLEFKAEWKLYQADGKLVEIQRDEFIKDILGLANGNSNTIRKTKYLIVGADDVKLDNGERVVCNVDYKVPTSKDISTWLNSACTPAVVGLNCELVSYKSATLFIITIPPTFDLHETIRPLKAKGSFHENTVFMRQGEHTVTASVRDGITIQQLKHLHREEIANPSSAWIGAVVGGFVSFITGQAKIRSTQINLPVNEGMILAVMVVFGIVFGLCTGLVARWYQETRYDWRFMPRKQKIATASFVVILCLVAYWLSSGR